ncbi:MAG TPA: SEC-C domain-containing protein [Candidatus Deferrimicrobiaceae bacterium]
MSAALLGRNAPCPCGSGLKYKKCCYEKDRAETSRARDERSAVDIALAYLYDEFPDEVDDAIDHGFLGGLEDEEYARLEHLPPEDQAELDINIGEWLLADAVLQVDEESVFALDLVLGEGGPMLPPQGRDRLIAASERPLSLYDVIRVTKGEGIELQDLVYPADPPVRVRDASLSESAQRGDIFGARIVRQGDDWLLSEAFYPMPEDFAHDCLNAIFLEQEEAAKETAARPTDPESDASREIPGPIIIDYWLLGLAEE